MSETLTSSSSIAAVPEDVHQVLLVDGTDVQSKVGHVAKFQVAGENNVDIHDENVDDFNGLKTTKASNQFIGLTKEELQSYINDPKWKRIRWIISILYLAIILLLLIGSVFLVLRSPSCPPKPKRVWYQQDIIYEIDVTTFRDADQNGIGDIRGLLEKLPYLENNRMKSILLQSSIFNSILGTSIQLDGANSSNRRINLLTIDPKIGNNSDLQNLTKILGRKNMHLIIDLPLSSTIDLNGFSWYSESKRLTGKVKNPCIPNQLNLACRYSKSYGRFPLDFSNSDIAKEAEFRLRLWLTTNKFDGVRIDVPLKLNGSSGLYDVSYDTIEQWDRVKNEIEKKSKPKLLLIDIPSDLQDIIISDALQKKTSHSLLSLLKSTGTSSVTAQQLNERMESFESKELSETHFWKLGSKRRSDQLDILRDQQLSKEMILTMMLLIGGTPILLNGDELGLEQKSPSLMPWGSDSTYGGFSSCKSDACARALESYMMNSPKTNVKLQEAIGGGPKDSLLSFYRRLAKLREQDSFQFGLSETGADSDRNLFWFIREAPGHRGYVVLFNLNRYQDEPAHVSLPRLTDQDVPEHIHYEYQWPNVHLPTSNTTPIHSDNLVIHPQSINIFWWKPKLLKPKAFSSKAKRHSNRH